MLSLTKLMELSPRDRISEKVINWALNRLSTEAHRGRITKFVNTSVDRVLERAEFESFAPEGTRWSYLCSECGKISVYTVGNPNDQPPKYCGEGCRERRKDQMNWYRRNPAECPTPGKTVYRSHDVASKTLAAIAAKNPEFKWNYAYACKCGNWHTGRKKYEPMEKN